MRIKSSLQRRKKRIKKERQKLLDLDMEFIKFSTADATWYIDTAYRVAWDYFITQSPEYGPRLRELQKAMR